jgi:hypothetical protein
MSVISANRFNWWLPFYGLMGAVVVDLPMMIFGNGVLAFLATALLGTIITLVVFVFFFRTIRRQSPASLLLVAIFIAASCGLFKVSDDVHTAGRWLLQSGQYRAEILAQPDSPNGELKHADWDIWGFAGAETMVYLVFDPNDSLRVAAGSHSPGKYSGIPCEVPNVRRLENHWYTVRFYTNTDWNHCS